MKRLRRLLPRRWPSWRLDVYTDGPVFDFWCLGWVTVIRDRTRSYYRFGWRVSWNDDD